MRLRGEGTPKLQLSLPFSIFLNEILVSAKILIFATNLTLAQYELYEQTIKNPSRKLEAAVRKIGVQKYLWLEKFCSNETQPTRLVKN